MHVERSMNDDFLSNTYLVGEPGGPGFLVDAGGPVAPLLDKGVEVTHVLLTHHHWDHVSELGQVLERFPDAQVLIEPRERELLEDEFKPMITGELTPGGSVQAAGHDVKLLHTPGHTAGMLSLLVEGEVFTGDTLFKGSVGGNRAPGGTNFADVKHSVMDVLLALEPDVVLRPGHTDPSTVAEEWESNAFVRVWRGLDPEGDAACTALDEPATLILWAPDYDGGHKAWVRWPDGTDDIVAGSKVQTS